MNLRQELLKEHSKAQCNKIVNWVGNSQERFDELFQLFILEEDKVMQRASWPMSYCVEAYPALIKKHIHSLITNLQKPSLHDAVKRNSIRVLRNINTPAKYHGLLMDTCFRLLASATEAVAIKSFSLIVLGNLAEIYPEIISEIKYLIDDQVENQTAAFKCSAQRVLKKINS